MTSRYATFLWVVSVCSGAATGARAQGGHAGRFISVSSTTTIRRPTAPQPLNAVRNMPLEMRDTIATGSDGGAQLLLHDGSSHALARNTLAQILPPEGLLIDLKQGGYRGRPGPRSVPRVPGGRISPHGTELDIQVAGGVTTLAVIEGEADLENDQGRVTVREGQESTVREGQAPTRPVAADLPILLEWTNDLQPVVLLLERAYVSQDRSVLAAALRQALPSTVEGWRRRGDLLHDPGDLDDLLKAREAYQSALALLGPAAAARRASPPVLLTGRVAGASETAPPTPRSAAPERAALEARLGQTWLELGKLTEAEAAFRRSLAVSPTLTEAHTGLVMTLLSRRQIETALAEARTGVERDGGSAEAHTVHALALIRDGKREEARVELARAVALDERYAPAYAWQSFLLRAGERLDDAYLATRKAVVLAPYSSLARQSLSEALFALNRLREARQQASRAVELNPLSPGAHASLGRCLLQTGNLEAAVREAGQAVALDPDLSRARFLLGVALAEQRRLARAAYELKRAVELDPDYLEAQAFLARVYLEQGKTGQAEAVARAVRERQPDFAPARAALGQAYYEAGSLERAAGEFREALKHAPASALYHLELARVYLDQNNLPDALAHGLEAVNRAPGSSEAHAVLGLIYDRRSSTEQARREYRAALSLSPENALARLGLATSDPRAGERVREVRRVLGGSEVSFSTADTGDSLSEVAQALLRDPPVLARIFKPGVTTELTPGGGADETYAFRSTHRDRFAEGRLFDLSFGSRERSANYRNGHPEQHTFGWVNLAAAPNYRTHVLAQYLYTGRDQPLPGALGNPTPGDESAFWENSWDLSTRYQLAPSTAAWLHAANRVSSATAQIRHGGEARFELSPGSLRYTTALHTSPFRQLGVEGRLDHDWGGGHITSYSLFAGRNRIQNRDLSFDRVTREFRETHVTSRDHLVAHTLQHDYRRGEHLLLILGIKAEHSTSAFRLVLPGEVVERGKEPAQSQWLPFGQVTYVLSRRSLARVTARRTSGSGFDALLPPVDAFLVNAPEEAAELTGQTSSYELDYEHRLSPKRFATLFLFQDKVSQFDVAPALRQSLDPVRFTLLAVRGRGAGLRYEHQVGRYLSSSLLYTYREFTDQTACSRARREAMSCLPPGRQVPLTPRSRAILSLSYIDRAGTKILTELDWSSRMNVGAAQASPWHQLPARMHVNLRLGQERSVRREWTLSIDNLLNTRTFYWSDFPAPGRTYRLQYSVRF